MAKIKLCLNDACTQFIYTDDGREIIQPRGKCDPKSISKDFESKRLEVIKGVHETVHTDKKLFKKAKEGKELSI